MAQVPVKCEVKTLTFQRVVVLHRVDGPLPADDTAANQLARADETLVAASGGSHLHVTTVPDPVVTAVTFDDAVKAAQAQVDAIQIAAAKLTPEEIAGAKLLVSVGRSLQDVAALLVTSPEAVQVALGA
jgi:hypothetical protein